MAGMTSILLAAALAAAFHPPGRLLVEAPPYGLAITLAQAKKVFF